jgi:SAM-dependent methyltransferase
MMEHSQERGEAEAERTPKRVFVEMGTNSLAASWMGDGAIGPDDLYVGVDIHKKFLETSQELTDAHERMSKNKIFVQADAERMPVRSGIAHEVFLGNVLGDPGITDRMKNSFIAEARRIVADDGRVVVKENNTPAELGDVLALLRKNGFHIEAYIDSRSPKWSEALLPYDRTSAARTEERYAVSGYIVYAVPELQP